MTLSSVALRFSAIVFLTAGTLAAQSTVNISVSNQVDANLGLKGRAQLAMSTSFQLAGWSYQFFDGAPGATGPLNALNPFHTRVQVIADGVPLTAPQTWDFTELNTMLSPIQGTGDHSPEFQIGTAPAFMSDAQGHILPGRIADFAQMSANLVRYYNTGGFDQGGQHFQSPTPYPITWWGIFNEPDINGVTSSEYLSLYNTVVPQMAQADPNIKFVAAELAAGAEGYLPLFITGVTAPVDVLAKHFYSTCSQRDVDQTLFASVPAMGTEVRSIISELALNPKLTNVPVWITENNVNADYDKGNGISACNSPLKFVLDRRGSSAFFAAWRALVFQELAKAGAQALYHWGFGTDPQFGEVDNSANPFFSYWVDYYLAHWLPTPPGQDILKTTASGCCTTDAAHGWLGSGGLPLDTQTMAFRNPDGSVVLLMSNYSLQASSDNNGPGVARTFQLDLSGLGQFTSAALVLLDAMTPAGGPRVQSLTPAAAMQVTLPGYGAALLRLTNQKPALSAAGVVNAASFAGGAVTPGEMVSLFGTGLGPTAGANLELSYPRLVSNSAAGVHAWFDGIPATLTYVSASQVNAVVPLAVQGKSSTVLQVEYLGASSDSITLPVAAAAPAIFTSTTSGSGQGAILNVTDGKPNSPQSPATRGDWVSIFGTGGGPTTPAGADGLLTVGPYPRINGKVTVTIGGIPCQVNYAGAAPFLVTGVMQVNAQVPLEVTPGVDVPVEVKVGNLPSQAGVTLAVQ